MPVRKLFAIVAVTLTLSANETSYRSLQGHATPLHHRGITGEGQVIAILDTGVDVGSCYFTEADGTLPPFNTGTPQDGLEWSNVDASRRKIIAYDFLYSCDQYPGSPGCDDPAAAGAFDNHGHGTHAAAAAAGDRDTPLVHDYADAIAPGAQLVVQDAGYIGGDLCSQRPGIGCPVELTPILEQAYRQGARIHSNSWGDRQGTPFNPPTANYPQSARDVDAFVWTHPDMLVVFNTGNLGDEMATPLSSLSAPGSAKNTLQVGATRSRNRDDGLLAPYTLFGPTRDGRIKPDLVAPGYVLAGDRDRDGDPATCDTSSQSGTSWSAPTAAGAAALVRQYYVDGFYPTGVRNPEHAMAPSAALVKATMIAAARAVPLRRDLLTNSTVDALPVPSHEQGWGFPVLDDALYFAGESRAMHVIDVPLERGLAAAAETKIDLEVRAGTPLRVVLVWTDPAGTVRPLHDTTPLLVNDLDLRVASPQGVVFGNGAPDRLNNVEVVSIASPVTGRHSITVAAHRLGVGPRQSYALVVTGHLGGPPSRARAVRR